MRDYNSHVLKYDQLKARFFKENEPRFYSAIYSAWTSEGVKSNSDMNALSDSEYKRIKKKVCDATKAIWMEFH